MKAQGGAQGEFNESPRGGSGSSPLRSDDSHDEAGPHEKGQRQTKGTTGVESTQIRWFLGSFCKQGWLGCMSSSQKTLKKSLKLKRDYQAWVHSDEIVLVVVRQGGWTAWAVAKDDQMKVGKGL